MEMVQCHDQDLVQIEDHVQVIKMRENLAKYKVVVSNFTVLPDGTFLWSMSHEAQVKLFYHWNLKLD